MSEDNNAEETTDDWAEALQEQTETETKSDQTETEAIPEQADAEADWGDALKEQQEDNPESAPFKELEGQDDQNSDISEIDHEELKLDVILDVPVTVSMEIGRTQVNIRNLLQLNQGSVIELDRFAGEPMDVLVNGTLIAHGEVVVVNDKFGIRLTDVISPTERVKKLG